MKPKVYVGSSISDRTDAELQRHFEIVGKDRIGEAEGFLGVVPDGAMLDAAPNLQAIATFSAGYDNYDVPELTRRGVALLNCPDAPAESTADIAFGLILATARRIVELSMWTKSGQWRSFIYEDHFGVDVHGKALGIVGLGRIGSAVARRGVLGFGMTALYTGPSPKREAEEQYGARRCELHELLALSDFVCLTLPLRPDTERLIGERELALMKPSSILVNVARGRIVDETALVQALQEGRILGAGLDVYEEEPLPLDSPLLALPNAVVLPHIGSATKQTRDSLTLVAVQNLVDYLILGQPRNIVNPGANGSNPD